MTRDLPPYVNPISTPLASFPRNEALPEGCIELGGLADDEDYQLAKAPQSDNVIVAQFHLMILNFPSFNKIQRPQPRTPQLGPTQ